LNKKVTNLRENPNKYLIKNNIFIRDFKRLYSEIKDPWGQDKKLHEDITFLIVNNFLNKIIKSSSKKLDLLDVGAGKGSLKKYISKKFNYIGSDINKKKFKTVIDDDITKHNVNLVNRFDVIVCLKTIYYVSDKIDIVLNNFKKYLRNNGMLIISYNLKKDSYSNKFLTDIKLRKILIKKKFKENYTIEMNRELYFMGKEKFSIFVFNKV
jgi:2-polyprenyl-3-methyl-5-hydroxy-6-metoxy-1,4-benzoquinol methylase